MQYTLTPHGVNQLTSQWEEILWRSHRQIAHIFTGTPEQMDFIVTRICDTTDGVSNSEFETLQDENRDLEESVDEWKGIADDLADLIDSFVVSGKVELSKEQLRLVNYAHRW